MDGHPRRVCTEYFEWMVEERDIIPREIHGYSLWPHMLFSPRVHTVTERGRGEGEDGRKKKHEREREREREKDRNTKGRRDGAGRASRKFFIL